MLGQIRQCRFAGWSVDGDAASRLHGSLRAGRPLVLLAAPTVNQGANNADPHRAETRHVLRPLITVRWTLGGSRNERQACVVYAEADAEADADSVVSCRKNNMRCTISEGSSLRGSSRENWPMASCTQLRLHDALCFGRLHHHMDKRPLPAAELGHFCATFVMQRETHRTGFRNGHQTTGGFVW